MDALILSPGLWEQMQQHVAACLPEEACGLLAGQGNQAQVVYPVPNSLHSPVRFLMDAQEQLAAFLDMDERGLDLLAIYHSHPAGPDLPSPTDLAEFAYPGSLYLIWSYPPWGCRAYHIEGQAVTEIELQRIQE